MGVLNAETSIELTLRFPSHKPDAAVIAIPFMGEVKGTPIEDKLRAIAVDLGDDKFQGKDVEIHVQNAFGLTAFVVGNE